MRAPAGHQHLHKGRVVGQPLDLGHGQLRVLRGNVDRATQPLVFAPANVRRPVVKGATIGRRVIGIGVDGSGIGATGEHGNFEIVLVQVAFDQHAGVGGRVDVLAIPQVVACPLPGILV